MTKELYNKIRNLFIITGKIISLKKESESLVDIYILSEVSTYKCSDGSISTLHLFDNKNQIVITNDHWVDKDLNSIKMIYSWDHLVDTGKFFKHDYLFNVVCEGNIIGKIPQEAKTAAEESIQFYISNIDKLTEDLNNQYNEAKHILGLKEFGLREDSFYIAKKKAEEEQKANKITISGNYTPTIVGTVTPTA